MKTDLRKQQFSCVERITHHLMLNSYFIADLGLFHGQMGVILAMSEYSRYTNSEIYFEVASSLLDNVRICQYINTSF